MGKLSKENIDFIMANAGGNVKEIAFAVGISEGYVSVIWRKHGYFKKTLMYKQSRDKHKKYQDYVKENYGTKTYKQMREETGVPFKIISKIVSELGLAKKHKSHAKVNPMCVGRPAKCFECPLADCMLSSAIGSNDKETEFIKIGNIKKVGKPATTFYNDYD